MSLCLCVCAYVISYLVIIVCGVCFCVCFNHCYYYWIYMYYWINSIDLMFLSSVVSCIQLSLLLQVLILCHFYFYSCYSCCMLKNIPKHFCWKRFGLTHKMAGKASNKKRSVSFLSIMTSLVFQLKCMFVCDSEVHEQKPYPSRMNVSGQMTKTREALSMCSVDVSGK